jgi:hypothetical protein
VDAYFIGQWLCCLREEEYNSLLYTWENTPLFLPHVAKEVWQAALEGYGIPTDGPYYDAFISVFGVTFTEQEVMGVTVEVVNLPDGFWLALAEYEDDPGFECPDPCKPAHFTDI